MAGKRDRVMLLLGLADALRRSELAALNVEDLTYDEAGVDVLVRRSKTDQEGAGKAVAVPHGTHLLPVQALQAWLAAAGITTGPIFRAVSRSGMVADEAITGTPSPML